MSVFLVDYENTHSLSGIATLSKDDKVVIFYSQNANSLTFDTHKRIMESPATVEYKYVGTGSQNALDFQLSTYLGYLVSTHNDSDEKIVIVSRDKGFNNVVSFWKHELSLEIQIAPNLCVETPQTATDNAEQQAAATVAQPQEEQIAATTHRYRTGATTNGANCRSRYRSYATRRRAKRLHANRCRCNYGATNGNSATKTSTQKHSTKASDATKQCDDKSRRCRGLFEELRCRTDRRGNCATCTNRGKVQNQSHRQQPHQQAVEGQRKVRHHTENNQAVYQKIVHVCNEISYMYAKIHYIDTPKRQFAKGQTASFLY